MIPERPPIVNSAMKPRQKRSGAWSHRLPRQSVASQLKILIEVGTATANDVTMNHAWSGISIPTVNMWCAQTSMLAKAMPIVENAIAL
jgi:hypothetical protein